ncbi:MAG: uroporphyrinogen decarboxylase family protein [Deltaproteobacteria bacterium]|nr:uroporphyrinogen decarboxylase family protein [Deltaproteobacteria bacterium]
MTYSAMDRFKDALKGKPRDRVPIFPMVAGWVAANFADSSPSKLAKDPRRILDAQVKARETVGYDALYAYGHPLYIPPALSLNLQLVSLLSDYSKGRFPVLGLFEGPFTTTTRIIEAEIVLRMIVKSRHALNALLDRITLFLIEFGKALIHRGANVLFVPEPSSSASMISPKMFRDFALPRLKMLTEELTVPVILHMCGDTAPMLEAMGESGVHVLSLDQCMDLSDTRKRMQKTVLGGNVDPVNALLMGTREDVVKDTTHCLETAGTSRFVLMSGCGVPPGTPVENLKAMVDTAVDYGLG